MDVFSRLAAMSALLATAATLEAQTRIIYVDGSAPVGGDGSSWSAAIRDLSVACDAANQSIASDPRTPIDLRIAQGTYRATSARVGKAAVFSIGIVNTFPYTWASGISLTMYGGYAGRQTSNPDLRDPTAFVSVLSSDVNGDDQPGFNNRADNAATVLGVWADNFKNIEIDGFTFEGGELRGYPPAPGLLGAGGVSLYAYSLSGYATVQNCRFIENTGYKGGGMASFGTNVRDCVFESNRAIIDGGGMHNEYGLAENCTFRNNQAPYGGAAAGLGDYLRCAIVNNVADERGGGLYFFGYGCAGCAPEIRECLIAGNSAGVLGGGASCGSNQEVSGGKFVHCTVVKNAAGWGGGIHAGRTIVMGSSLDGNSAMFGGDQISQADLSLEIHSSLVRGGIPGIYRAFGGKIESEGVLDGDPGFVDAFGSDGLASTVVDNNYRLRPDSICLDRVTPYQYYFWQNEMDLDGLTRSEPGPTGDGRTDLGCYEWRQTCPADFDNSGGTPDMTDLAAFFEAFSAGDAAADVNKSGGTPDSDDIEAFFNVWLAGGC